MSNESLIRAKQRRYDEFYTRRIDIEEELQHYTDQLAGKVVYCNCDKPGHSAFFNCFADNYAAFKLKKLIVTYYDPDKPVHATVFTEEGISIQELNGNGDFRSDECVQFLKGSDIVITNPPFSLFREFVSMLMQYKKKFLIIGSLNAVTYKEFFPLLANNTVSIGYSRPKAFLNSNGTLEKFGSICWYTNLCIDKRISLNLSKKYNPESYPRYLNYDAINVDRVANIPVDYAGVMGVPITFMLQYNPDQFEIVSFRKGNDNEDLVYEREREREREFIPSSEF
jgi:hypothetical protein